MNVGKSGDVNGALVNGRREVCTYQRLVDDHVNEYGAIQGAWSFGKVVRSSLNRWKHEIARE